MPKPSRVVFSDLRLRAFSRILALRPTACRRQDRASTDVSVRRGSRKRFSLVVGHRHSREPAASLKTPLGFETDDLRTAWRLSPRPPNAAGRSKWNSSSVCASVPVKEEDVCRTPVTVRPKAGWGRRLRRQIPRRSGRARPSARWSTFSGHAPPPFPLFRLEPRPLAAYMSDISPGGQTPSAETASRSSFDSPA